MQQRVKLFYNSFDNYGTNNYVFVQNDQNQNNWCSMLNATMARGRAKRVNAYLSKDILDASPQKLLLKVYDYAIANCRKKDLNRTNKALNQLINSLNFENNETKEFSLGLMGLYQFCQDQMRKGEYEIVEKILIELRDSWVDIFTKGS